MSEEMSTLGPESPKKRIEFDIVQKEERTHLGNPDENDLTALCLSGGGIRSAAFAMGVLRGLAKQGALGGFHYLSTVSGGGYAGGWLSAWAHRHEQGLTGVIEDLVPSSRVPAAQTDCADESLATESLEPMPLKYVRVFASYLSPRWGLLSADTWTLVGIYLRNLLITAVVLVPLMAAVLMLPRLNMAMLDLAAACLGGNGSCPAVPWAGLPPPSSDATRSFLLLVAGAFLAIAVGSAHVQRVYQPYGSDSNPLGDTGAGDRRILSFFVLPGVLAFVVLTWLLAAETPDRDVLIRWGLRVTGGGMLGGFLLEFLAKFLRDTEKGARIRSLVAFVRGKKEGETIKLLVFRSLQFGGALGAGYTGGWFCYGVSQTILRGLFDTYVHASEAKATFGPLLLLSVGLLASTIFIGSISQWMEDQDRELSARAGAWALIAMTGLGAGHGIALYGPIAASALFERAIFSPNALLALSGTITGLITAVSGLSPTGGGPNGTPAQRGRFGKVIDVLTVFAAPLFLLQILLTIAFANRMFFEPIGLWSLGLFRVDDPPTVAVILAWAGLLVALMYMAGWLVKLNEFSLHGLYKSRLVRTFLGASRIEGNDKRTPNRFTGFDERDDLPIHKLFEPPKPGSSSENKAFEPVRLLHVVNMALNVGRDGDLALQYRKALPFTVSGLHAGYGRCNYRRTGPNRRAENPIEPAGENEGLRFSGKRAIREAGRKIAEKLEWKPKTYFGDGITLGTALTISGAAASPNMGYHSSPVVTFLLTLLNVRLGRWLGNTSDEGDGTFARTDPGESYKPIVQEAFGMSSPKSRYVYLSDGGHFDNLGLYSMVARRCSFILVSDASADPEYSWNDLARAVQLIRIDFGVRITFHDEPADGDGASDWNDVLLPNAGGDSGGSPMRYRVGTIEYAARYGDMKDGMLIVLKPAVLDRDPVDVRNYQKRSSRFPHDSTAIQWFSEEQFEAYRTLGEETVCALKTCCNVDEQQNRLPSDDEMGRWIEATKKAIHNGSSKVRAEPA